MSGLIAPLKRFRCGGATFGDVTLSASGITLAEQPIPAAYMPWPDAEGDLLWEGGQFGIVAAEAGANVTNVSVSVTYRVSDPASFSSVTGWLLLDGSPIMAPQQLPFSAVNQTATLSVRTGVDPELLPGLSLRIAFHQTAMGFGIVSHALAVCSWAYADNIGIATIACRAAIPAPGVHVYPPPAQLASAGAAVPSLAPAFGRETALKDSLVAWVFSNSGTSESDIVCETGGWVQHGVEGGMYGWTALFVRERCKAGESPPVFSASGNTVLSQLLELSGVSGLDAVASGFNDEAPTITLAMSEPDSGSGDLTLVIGLWPSSAAGAQTPALTGTDSSGAALGLAVQTNGDDPETTTFYAVGWAQASPPVGPGVTTVTASNTEFAGAICYLLTFKTAFSPVPHGPGRSALTAGLA